jgi:hypothetical protein
MKLIFFRKGSREIFYVSRENGELYLLNHRKEKISRDPSPRLMSNFDLLWIQPGYTVNLDEGGGWLDEFLDLVVDESCGEIEALFRECLSGNEFFVLYDSILDCDISNYSDKEKEFTNFLKQTGFICTEVGED